MDNENSTLAMLFQKQNNADKVALRDKQSVECADELDTEKKDFMENCK